MSIRKVNLTSFKISKKKLEELHHILPEAFSENKINWERLRSVLGDEIDERIEKFSFTWAGKSNAIKNVLIPSKATLRPARDESVKFNASENLFIEGDNLEVLKLLQKAYFEKVKMIYIDPPYNTGGEFVYRDDFAAPLKNYLHQTGQIDRNGNKLKTNHETNGRYHSDWLSMMYPRLKLAWNLLKEDGVIFVSIDDNEVHNLRQIMNEIFGEENFVDCIIWKKRYGGGSKEKYLVTVHEYVLFYAKNIDKIGNLEIPLSEESINRYYTKKDKNFEKRGPYRTHPLEAGRAMEDRENLIFPIIAPDGKETNPRRQWLWSRETVKEALKFGEIEFTKISGKWIISTKQYLKDRDGNLRDAKAFSLIDDVFTQHGTNEMISIFGDARIFPYPKPVDFVKKLLKIGTKKDSLIIDFFAGSASTAHAILDLNKDGGNRKFIMVQIPEPTDENSEAYKAGYKTISDISKERIRRVIKGYGNKPQPIDDGFKVFKLTKSNYPENQFEFDPKNTEEENKKAFTEYLGKAKQSKLLDDTKTIDVVYENIVKEGLSLNSWVAEQKLGKNNTYLVTDGVRQLLVCLDNKINSETVSELTSKDYKGKTFICLDGALDDTAKANLGLHVELKTI